MSTRRKLGHWFTWALSILTIAAVAFGTIVIVDNVTKAARIKEARAVVWNEVSYPQGNVGTVVPDKVLPGGTINIIYKEYCNSGVDVSVTRWIDFLRADGTKSASFGLRIIEFFPTPAESGCWTNLTQPFTIPPDLAGRPGGTDTVRVRTVTSYVKPYQIVQVPAFSEPFSLLPNK